MSRLRTSRWLALAAAASFLAACGDDATGLLNDARATLSVTPSSAPVLSIDAQGYPTISCHVVAEAQAVGLNGLRWTGGVLRWYAGVDRATPIDTSTISAQDMVALVGGSELEKGARSQSAFTVEAGIPFEGELEAHYVSTKASVQHRVSSRFSCGPKPDGTIPKPTVALDNIVIDTPPLQPGGVLRVTYTANSAYTLWRTMVGFSGPCTANVVTNEPLGHTSTHTVAIRIPAACTLGTPLTVFAAALDGAAQEGSISAPPTLYLSDVTPPTVNVSFDRPGAFGAAGQAPLAQASADFFDGDTILLRATVTDNNKARVLSWEVQPAGIRDSIALGGDSTASVVARIPVSASWGAFQLRVTARDAAGNTSAPVENAVGGFVAHPSTMLPTTTVSLDGPNVSKILYDDRSDRLFVFQPDGNRILVYSGATLALQQTIALGFWPNDFDVAPGGDTLVVTPENYSQGYTLVDLSSGAPRLQPIPFGLGYPIQPSGVMLLANGHVLMNALDWSSYSQHRLLEIDLPTLTVRDRTNDGASSLSGRSGDRNVAYLTGVDGGNNPCGRRFDAGTDSFGPCAHSVPGSLVSTTMTGDMIAIDGTLFDPSFQQIRTTQFPNAGWAWSSRPVFSADGATLYRSYQRGVVRARVSDGAMIDLVHLPYAPGSIAASADGSTLFAAQYASNYYDGGKPRLSRISLH